MNNIRERISKVTEQMKSLEQEKHRIEDKIDKSLRDISRLTKSIKRAEDDLRIAKNKLVRECPRSCYEGDNSKLYGIRRTSEKRKG